MSTIERILTGNFVNNKNKEDEIYLKYLDGKLTGKIKTKDGNIELLSGELVTSDLIILRSIHLDGSIGFYIFEAFSLLELRGIYVKKNLPDSEEEGNYTKYILKRRDIEC